MTIWLTFFALVFDFLVANGGFCSSFTPLSCVRFQRQTSTLTRRRESCVGELGADQGEAIPGCEKVLL